MNIFKGLPLIFVLIFTNNLNAQLSWPPPSAEWTYRYIYLNGDSKSFKTSVTDEYLLGDTLVRVITPESNEAINANAHLSIHVFSDEQGDKLYRLIEDEWHLLYDFSLSVDDTMKVFINPINQDFSDEDKYSYFIVDSTGVVDSANRQLKKQYLRIVNKGQFLAANSFAGWRYQYLGNTSIFFTPYFSLGCDGGGCPRQLRCYSDDTIGEFKLTDIPCDTVIRVSTNEVPDLSQALILHPNPVKAGDNLLLTWADQVLISDPQIRLLDATGRRVNLTTFATNNGYNLHTKQLPAGVYFLTLTGPEGRATKRLLLQ